MTFPSWWYFVWHIFRMSLCTYLTIMPSIVYVVHSSGRYTPPNNYIFLIISSINFPPHPRVFIRPNYVFPIFFTLIQMFFCKSNPIFTVYSTHQTSFFCCWTFRLWKSYLCNIRGIVWLHTVFLVVFSTISRSFGALSQGFFRILSSTYLSCLALTILLFGFVGSFFMDSVYLNLLTIYCKVV
jgi:hypothetical protein